MASIVSAGTTSGTSLNLSADTSGVLQLATNGTTTAVTIDTSQNVGIGTASPAFPLDVVGRTSDAVGISIRGRSSDNVGSFRFYSNDGATFYSGLRSASNEFRVVAVTAIPLTFYTTNTERMRIDSSGNVGIGTSSPTRKLQVKGIVGFEAISGSTNTWENYTFTDNSLRWNYNGAGADEMTITSSGNVGIGTDSPTDRLHIVTDGTSVYNVFKASNANSTATMVVGVAGSAVAATSLQNNAYLWNLGNSALSFGTNDTERMRIVSNGDLAYLCTGLDGDRPNAVGSYKQSNGNTKVRVVSDGTAAFQFYSPTGGGSPVGSISANASSTTYATSSDYRLKENIAPMTGALAKVTQLKPCTYTWKSNGSAGEGFIAHELQAVVPEAVIGEKDAVNEDGSIKPQGIDTSFLVATLTAALQELNAKVEAQAAEIALLKSK